MFTDTTGAKFMEIKAPSTSIRVFLNPQLVIPDTASVHKNPANSGANPDIFKSAL